MRDIESAILFQSESIRHEAKKGGGLRGSNTDEDAAISLDDG